MAFRIKFQFKLCLKPLLHYLYAQPQPNNQITVLGPNFFDVYNP